MNEQHTLSRPLLFEGVGLHTGRPAKVVVSPAEAGTGLIFVLDGGVRFPALVDYVVDTSRATVLGDRGASVSTVEHLLSALSGCGVDNAVLTVEGPEIPVMDGSAAPFVEQIHAAGITAQGAVRRFVRCPRLELEENGMRVALSPADELVVDMTVDFRSPIGRQHFSATMAAPLYARDVAHARTFGYLDEIEALRARGLALGGSLENAVVFGPDGPLQPLRYDDEPVRHKVLDLIGDFALIGAPLLGRVEAERSGHALHAKIVRKLRELTAVAGVTDDVQAADIRYIMECLPHRYPMLLVDRILEYEPKKRVLGYKNVSANEPFAQGHFPGNPILPGVYMIEAMAQLSGIAVLLPGEFSRKVPYLVGIDKAKFRRPVIPGDQLMMEARLLRVRGPIIWITAKAEVDNQLACSAELMFSVTSDQRGFPLDASILHE